MDVFHCSFFSKTVSDVELESPFTNLVIGMTKILKLQLKYVVHDPSIACFVDPFGHVQLPGSWI